MGAIDFSVSTGIVIGLQAAALLPVALAVLSRLPPLRQRNALQFLLSTAAASIAGLALLVAEGCPRGALACRHAVDAVMVFVTAALLMLEIWALLSRGYTLGLMLTLLERGALTDAELARAYRGGEGLEWIMRHRLGGLQAAGMVTARDGRVALTPVRGVAVAAAYRACRVALGLRKTG